MFSHIPYIIYEKLLIQWLVLGLLHKTRQPLRVHENTTYEEDLRKE